MTPEQIAALWAEYLEAATPSGSTDLYDIEDMNDAAYALHQCCIAQSATPPAAVVEAMERALRHADDYLDRGLDTMARNITRAAIAKLEAWRAGK